MKAAAAEQSPPRLNPFAFAADTDLLFALFVVFIAGITSFQWVLIGADTVGMEGVHRFDACLQSHGIDQMSVFAMLDKVTGPPLFQCFVGYVTPTLLYMTAGLLLLASAALVIFAVTPAWVRYRWRACEITDEDVPGLLQQLRFLACPTGLRHTPVFLWNPLGMVPAAVSFGGFGRHRVVMTGALAVQFLTEPGAFRAMMLHELAHLRNGDVTKTMLALAVWRAFLITVLPAYFGKNVVGMEGVLDLVHPVMFAGIALMTLLTRNGLLRVRELYADVRVSSWQRPEQGIARLLSVLAPVAKWRCLLSPHPSPPRRLDLLRSTDPLFRFGSWQALGLGAATGVLAFLIPALFCGVMAAQSTIARPGGFGTLAVLLASPFVVVVCGLTTAGIVAWRSQFQAVMRGRRSAGVLRVSFAFSAGLSSGPLGLLAPVLVFPLFDADLARHAVLPPDTLASLLLAAASFAFLLGCTIAIYLYWVAAAAYAWTPVLLRWHRPGAVPVVTVGLACALALMVPLVGVILWYIALPQLARGGGVGIVAAVYRLSLNGTLFPQNLVACVCLLVLWSWPLAPALLTKFSSAATRGWAWLQAPAPLTFNRPDRIRLGSDSAGLSCVHPDRPDQGQDDLGLASDHPSRVRSEVESAAQSYTPLADPADHVQDDLGLPSLPLAQLRPGRAALLGLLGGAFTALCLRWLGDQLPVEIWRGRTGLPASGVPVYIRMLVAAMLLQTPIAIMATTAVPRLRILHAVLAINVAGLVMTVAVRLYFVAHPNLDHQSFPIFEDTCMVIIGGVAAALPSAVATQALLGALALPSWLIRGIARRACRNEPSLTA
jgi:Zn-dependent protease with chaperone function